MWEVFPYKCVLEVFYVDVFNENIFYRLANLSDCIRWWPDGRQNYIFLNYTLKEWNYITTWLNTIWRELPKARLRTYFLYQKTYVSFWFGLWKYHSNIFFVHTWFYDVCSQFSNLDEFDSHYCITGLKEVLLN